jgi:hypothetical protein
VAGLFEQPTYWTGSAWKMKPEYSQAGNCPNSYNDYKYGLDDRNSYASQLSTSSLINQYIKRKVHYILGELDTDPNDPSIDDSCPAKLDGLHRLKRGQNFYNFLNQYFAANRHTIAIVPNVAHEQSRMYNSAEAKAVLFN